MINIDFETFSASGYRWLGKWVPLEGAKQAGIRTVGAHVYGEHPSTEIICLVGGSELWVPGGPDPWPLLNHVAAGGLVSAWNCLFEYTVWNNCTPAHWPRLALEQLRDAQPRARAHTLPGALGKAAAVLDTAEQKDTGGESLIRLFSMPRNPTKLDRRLRVLPSEAPEKAQEFYEYCVQDVRAEQAVAAVLPQLAPGELEVWQLDLRINARGIPIDTVAVDHAMELLRQSETVLNAELAEVTAGAVTSSGQVAELAKFASLADVKAFTVTAALQGDELNPAQRRALEIRQALGSTSTKKVVAFKHRTSGDGRARGQFIYCGAGRTGRWAGMGFQPHNFPRGAAQVCELGGIYGSVGEQTKWRPEASEQFLTSLACRDYRALAQRWGDPLKALAASIRALVCAKPGHRLVCSDFRAIEAVVLAVLAGEEWRLEVFRTHGRIYETSAAMITGAPVDAEGNHPERQLGKLAELASGYGGGVGAWKNFGADAYFTEARCQPYMPDWIKHQADPTRKRYTLQDYAIQRQIWAWREKSPKIKAFWQGLQLAAMAAIETPDEAHSWRGISYVVKQSTLYCVLPSGRRLAYHQARIEQGRFGDAIFYYGNNTNPKFGAVGWVELDTYGGKLTENVVQAVSRDILAHAMVELDRAGYSIVMHVHDEVVCEEPDGRGSVEEVERIMGTLPDWAEGWPVIAAGGWEGQRYRK